MNARKTRLLVITCSCTIWILSSVVMAQEGAPRGGPVVLQPGDTHAFPAADVAGGSEPLGSAQICGTFPSILAPAMDFTGPLNVAVAGTTLADGAGCMVFRYNDFTVDAGPGGVFDGVPVPAMVSGKMDWAGVLMVLNIGTVNAVFSMDVLDVTDAAKPRVVASQTLAIDTLEGQSTLSFSFGLSVDAGSATAAQVGVNPGIGFGVPIQLKRIVRNTGFNIPALLQRGHTYRLNFSATTSLTAGPGGGAGAAIYVDALNLIGVDPGDVPDLLSPTFWIQTLTGGTAMNANLPNLNLGAFASQLPNVSIPAITLPWPSYFNSLSSALNSTCEALNPVPDNPGCPTWPTIPSSTTLLPATTLINSAQIANALFSNIGGSTTNDILAHLGLPTDLSGILNDFVGLTESTFPPFSSLLPQGGVQLSDLAVTIAVDEVEELTLHDDFVATAFAALGNATDAAFLNLNVKFDDWIDESTRIRIEESLISDNPVARFMLPEKFGGQLELVAQVVAETIQAMIDAGQPVFNAQTEFAAGQADQNAGNYKEAFRHYAKAYDRATQ